jgi:subtilisin
MLRQFFKIVTRIYVLSLWTIHEHTEKPASLIAKIPALLCCRLHYLPYLFGLYVIFKAFRYEIRHILQETAEDIGLSAEQQGYGLARADLAVRAADESEPQTTGNIEGTVKDDAETAIESATVVVEGTSLSTTTNADGYYLLENVPSGDQNVTASADGYNSETATVEVVEGETATQDFTLQAIQTYTVSGTVTDKDTEEPLKRATVTIEGTNHSATTESDGTYSIAGVEEGTYDITASADGYDPETKYDVVVDSDTGVDFTLTAKTETASLSIDKFELTDTRNPAWARVAVDWSVSDGDGNLETVNITMVDTDENEEVDSVTISVSGDQASGTDELRNRGGHDKTYDITITVTDTDDNSVSNTQEITL